MNYSVGDILRWPNSTNNALYEVEKVWSQSCCDIKNTETERRYPKYDISKAVLALDTRPLKDDEVQQAKAKLHKLVGPTATTFAFKPFWPTVSGAKGKWVRSD